MNYRVSAEFSVFDATSYMIKMSNEELKITDLHAVGIIS